MEIKFENIIIKPGYIKADYEDQHTNHYIIFELNKDVIVRQDLVALALTTLCGRKYSFISMELDISEQCKKGIELFTGATLQVKINNSTFNQSEVHNNHTLNFSGGFDSLATMALIPNNHSLVSMDFGGKFSREMTMINEYTSHIVKCNILETDFRKNSWTFMLISSILFKDYLQTKFNVIGSIINAPFMQNSSFSKNFSTPHVIRAAGMMNVPYSLTLSEIGTINIISQEFPEIIDSSLISLANPKEEKRFRKQLLLEIEYDRKGKSLNLSQRIEKPYRQYFKWGENFLADHLAIYIMKYKDYETASLTINNIPDEAYNLSQNLSLNFYDRYYTDILKFIPKTLRKGYLEKLAYYDILPFEENDWKEYREVLQFMSKYYKVT